MLLSHSPRRCPAPQAEGWKITLKYTHLLDCSQQDLKVL